MSIFKDRLYEIEKAYLNYKFLKNVKPLTCATEITNKQYRMCYVDYKGLPYKLYINEEAGYLLIPSSLDRFDRNFEDVIIYRFDSYGLHFYKMRMDENIVTASLYDYINNNEKIIDKDFVEAAKIKVEAHLSQDDFNHLLGMNHGSLEEMFAYDLPLLLKNKEIGEESGYDIDLEFITYKYTTLEKDKRTTRLLTLDDATLDEKIDAMLNKDSYDTFKNQEEAAFKTINKYTRKRIKE